MLLVVATFPLLFIGALGWEEGAFGWYAALALICLLQAAYPTLLGWTIAVAIYLVFSAIYVYATIADLIELARGHQASIFLSPSDDTVFAGLILAVLGIGIALVRCRPRPYE